jgi:hypothetical protein
MRPAAKKGRLQRRPNERIIRLPVGSTTWLIGLWRTTFGTTLTAAVASIKSWSTTGRTTTRGPLGLSLERGRAVCLPDKGPTTDRVGSGAPAADGDDRSPGR